jgi:phage/plasmid-like protein (TIGR03299 family)
MTERNAAVDVFTSSDRTVTIEPPPPPPESWRSWDPSEYAAYSAAAAGETRIEDTAVYRRALAEIDSLVVGGRPAWHGLGTTFPRELMTAEEALSEGGLDWPVVQAPLMADVDGLDVLTAGADILDVETHVANVRADRGTVLGVVGRRYEPVQNVDAFRFMDELVAGDRAQARYHTAGALYGGKTVFLTLALDREIRIGGDVDENLDPYLLLSNSHDGSGSFGVYSTAIRVACGNTQRLAIADSQLSWRYRHTAGVTGKISKAREALGMAWTYLDELEALGNRLVDVKLTPAEFANRFVPVLVPIPPKATDRQVANVAAVRASIVAVHDGADNLANVRGTAWGALQAVLEWEEHCSPARDSERRFERAILEPSPLRDRALAMLA